LQVPWLQHVAPLKLVPPHWAHKELQFLFDEALLDEALLDEALLDEALLEEALLDEALLDEAADELLVK